MGDSSAANLRSTLSRTDMSQPSIQSSAAAMMRLYDRAAPMAVSEWRSSLQTCRNDQLLPLLYVANEVLQTSKRNRGPKFLEAFAEVLAQSLRFICEKDRSVVEKVRRTAKIWGDRRVYSTRFVGELLAGLEDLRGGGATKAVPSNSSSAAAAPATTSAAAASPGKRRSVTDDDESDASGGKTNKDDDEDEFSSPFGSGPSHPLLSVDVTAAASTIAAAAAASSAAATTSSGSKRRRSSASPADGAAGSADGKSAAKGGGSAGDASSAAKAAGAKRRKKPAPPKKTNTALANLLESLSTLDDQFRSSQGTLDAIHPSHFVDTESSVADVVGDELIDLNRGAAAAARTLDRQRRVVHGIASERRRLEGQVAGYIDWLRGALAVDEEELAFCDRVEARLVNLSAVHAEAKAAREKRLDEEARQRALEEAERRRKEEEDERKRALEEAMKSKNTEAKPGMVWNKELREYQYIGDPAEESWRD